MVENNRRGGPEFTVCSLLISLTVTIQDTRCQGTCRSMSPEESTNTTQLIFPYRGVYLRHIGHDQAAAEPNQVLFFNAHEAYRVSRPIAGGDGSLTLVVEESQLVELAPVDISCSEVPGLHFVDNVCGSMPAPRPLWRFSDTDCAKKSRGRGEPQVFSNIAGRRPDCDARVTSTRDQ